MANDLVIKRLKALIKRVDEVISTDTPNPPGVIGFPTLDESMFYGWKSQSLNFLTGLLGKESPYTKEFKEKVSAGYVGSAKAGKGILESLLIDVENGYLASIQELIHANLFSDYLEMAEHLLKEGYKDPAAVIAGSSLEAHLKQLSEKLGLEINKPDGKPKKADTLNAELFKAKAYGKNDQKSVTAWLGLRNEAAHGNYDEYTKEKVNLLLMSIRNFISRFPA